MRDIIDSRDASNPCWWVPLSYSTKGKINFNQTTPENWLSCPSDTQTIQNVADDEEWIIFNNKMAGMSNFIDINRYIKLLLIPLISYNLTNRNTFHDIQLVF